MQKFRDVLSRWEGGSLSMMEAGELLGMSERQFRRYRDRFEQDGSEGLADRRVGKPSPKRVPETEARRMLELYRGRYRGWTASHFHDQLKREHSFRWGYTWVKTQLHAAGLLERAPRRGAHRRKRERKPCEGMMLHQDASQEVWLSGLPKLDLVVTMDDATSTIYSVILVEEEGTDSSFCGLLETFCAKGLPSSLYTDRGSHYFHTPQAGGTVDRSHLTQVGRALEQLGIEHIPAYSPEARGRSERMFGTLQDRLIKELALEGLRDDIAAANAWIRAVYVPRHNARFAQAPALPESGFVAVADRTALVEALCRHEERVVGRDNTVGFEGRRLQLPESPLRHHWVKAKVRVHQYPDATLAIFHGPRCIARYTRAGVLQDVGAGAGRGAAVPSTPSVTACSDPSRSGLDPSRPSAAQRGRPSLTAPARAVSPNVQVGTEKRPAGRTKKQASPGRAEPHRANA